MTAPNTNIERQKKRHRVPLVAFAVAGVVVAILVVVFSNYDVESEVVLTEPGAASAPQTLQEN